jgi:ABC-type transporter Mla subunit MlaD
MNPEQPKHTMDERLDALAMSLELLQAESQASSRTMEALTAVVAKLEALTAVVAKHEEEWERFRRAQNTIIAKQAGLITKQNDLIAKQDEMSAAFRKYCGEDDNNTKGNQQ